MAKVIKILGSLIDPFAKLDLNRFTPAEFRGKSAESRAAILIARGFKQGTEQVIAKYPELKHVTKTSVSTQSATT